MTKRPRATSGYSQNHFWGQFQNQHEKWQLFCPKNLGGGIHLISLASQIWSGPLWPICRGPKVPETEKHIWDLNWNQFLAPQGPFWDLFQIFKTPSRHFSKMGSQNVGLAPPRGHFEQNFKFFYFQLIIYVQRSHNANRGHFGKFFMPPGHLL